MLSARKNDLSIEGSLIVYGKGAKTQQEALSEATASAIRDYLGMRLDTSGQLFVSEVGETLGYEAIKSLFHRWKKADAIAFHITSRNLKLGIHICNNLALH